MNLISVVKGLPCLSSYWVGADREALRQRVAERRHQQAVPGEMAMIFDPGIGATAALADHRRRMPKLAQQIAPRVVAMQVEA
jgi:hypothetical protein